MFPLPSSCSLLVQNWRSFQHIWTLEYIGALTIGPDLLTFFFQNLFFFHVLVYLSFKMLDFNKYHCSILNGCWNDQVTTVWFTQWTFERLLDVSTTLTVKTLNKLSLIDLRLIVHASSLQTLCTQADNICWPHPIRSVPVTWTCRTWTDMTTCAHSANGTREEWPDGLHVQLWETHDCRALYNRRGFNYSVTQKTRPKGPM